MIIFVKGVPSVYELEHVARLFFPTATLAARYPSHREDVVYIRATKRRFTCAIRQSSAQPSIEISKSIVATAEATTQDNDKENKDSIELARARQLFHLLVSVTGTRPSWGMLTGVRPVRLVHARRQKGDDAAQLEAYFTQKFEVTKEKFSLAVRVANAQKEALAMNTPSSFSLYISIPFCPSRCSYCSFVSRTIAESAALIAPYVECLCEEIASFGAIARRQNLRLETVYIGGGTPTAISAAQLEKVMLAVSQNFDIASAREYTVEAGRPDCTTHEKLAVMKNGGATRISINPQTMSNAVLAAIGRKHTAQDIIDCYHQARAAGHTNINMDLIAGLPLDTPDGFVQSLKQVIALDPENITVHTLTLKRGSNLVTDHAAPLYGDVAQMVSTAQELLSQTYEPYYLYRQKGTLQNLENVGWAKRGAIGLYNVFIMEEVHTILSAGAGGSTKLVPPNGGSQELVRSFNYKYPLEYCKNFATLQARKGSVDKFYGQYFDMDSQTPC